MKKFCVYPFKAAEIYINGDVSCCWCPYLEHRYKYGNIFRQDFEEIWNGEKAKRFRRNVLKRKYTYCNLDMCIENLEDQLYFSDTDEGLNIESEYPVYVSFAHERSCTCHCTTCRDKVIMNDEKTTAKYDELIETKFLPMLKNAKMVEMSGSGEIFVSKHYQKLIKRITETYPNIKFYIITNGIYCTVENLKKLGLYDRLESLQISLHAATKETYDKIVRGGNFDKVCENLAAVKEMKDNGLIPEVLLNYVVSSMNFKEMPQFARWAQELDFLATFWDFRNWETSKMCKDFDKYAVFEPYHPQYNELKEVLKDDILFSRWSNLNEIFLKMVPRWTEEMIAERKEKDRLYDEKAGRKPYKPVERIRF